MPVAIAIIGNFEVSYASRGRTLLMHISNSNDNLNLHLVIKLILSFISLLKKYIDSIL